jgi:hypothetical protein
MTRPHATDRPMFWFLIFSALAIAYGAVHDSLADRCLDRGGRPSVVTPFCYQAAR